LSEIRWRRSEWRVTPEVIEHGRKIIDLVGTAAIVLYDWQQHFNLQAKVQTRPDPSCGSAHASNAVITHRTVVVCLSVCMHPCP
jgi:hypothetical protein